MWRKFNDVNKINYFYSFNDHLCKYSSFNKDNKLDKNLVNVNNNIQNNKNGDKIKIIVGRTKASKKYFLKRLKIQIIKIMKLKL